MAYHPKHLIFPTALSASALARSLGVRPAKVHAAVRAGELPVYVHGKARRILIEDAIRWVRETWKH